MNMHTSKDLSIWLKDLLEGIVAHPKELVIEEKVDDMGTLFTISSHKEDIGVLIGSKGDHVNAIRVLLRVHGHKHDIKASIKVIG